MVSELGNLTITWGKYGVLTARISSVSDQYEKEQGDRRTYNSIKKFLFKLIKHVRYKNLSTISSYDKMNHVMMAQKNKETNEPNMCI